MGNQADSKGIAPATAAGPGMNERRSSRRFRGDLFWLWRFRHKILFRIGRLAAPWMSDLELKSLNILNLSTEHISSYHSQQRCEVIIENLLPELFGYFESFRCGFRPAKIVKSATWPFVHDVSCVFYRSSL